VCLDERYTFYTIDKITEYITEKVKLLLYSATTTTEEISGIR